MLKYPKREGKKLNMYHDEDNYDVMHYDLELTFNVRIAKWRIDDPREQENIEWSLSVYDRNLEEWVNINDLNRPGEYGMLDELVIRTEKPMSAPFIPREDRPLIITKNTMIGGKTNG